MRRLLYGSDRNFLALVVTGWKYRSGVQEASRHLTSSWLREHKDPDICMVWDLAEALVQTCTAVSVGGVVVEDPDVGQWGLYLEALRLFQEHAQLVDILRNLPVMQTASCDDAHLKLPRPAH
ncbi:MAG: hypothetical protein HHJ11_19050 [Phycicoccus sp.]|nr:hypothetical protein [Phycicoccus sp.]